VGGFVLPQKEQEMIETNITPNKQYTTDPALLEQQIRQAQSQERYYQQQKKILLHEQSQLERKKRNHRIFTRGGMLEAFMQKPLLMTDDQVYRLLQTAFNTKEVTAMESELLVETIRELSPKDTENSD
jgi:hypothetical protein